MKSLHALIASLIAAAALLVGCGGGSDSTESTSTEAETTAALTKAELIERGDGICAEVNAALGTVGASETGGAAQSAGLYTSMIASLQNLGAPREAAGYREFIAAAEALSRAEGEVKLAAERGDAAGLETAEANASTALADFQATAGEYGFEKCGAGPSAPPATPESNETGGAEAPVGEAAEPEAEAAPEAAPETGGAAGAPEEGGAGGGTEGGGTTGGSSGGIGPG